MSNTSDTTSAGYSGTFDPRQAAAMLDQTTHHARRQLEPFPPWLVAIRGFMALAAYGAAWLSVRDQHPYQHPTAVVIPVVVALGVLNLVATVAVARRATAGVTGRTRLGPAEITIWVVLWAGVFAIMGVLVGSGVSDSVVYGLYPVTVPLMVAGLAWAGTMAARAEWRRCGTALAVAVVGAVALAAGPAGAWAVAGVGLCVTLVGTATVIAWQQRRTVVQP